MPVGLGKQTLTFNMNDQASVAKFNSQYVKLIKPGIYRGGSVDIVSGDTVKINTFILLVETNDVVAGSIIVKVSTEESVIQLVDESTPYLTFNLTWTNDANDSGEFSTKDIGSLYANDIIFGKAEFTGGVITGIDYSEKTWGLFDENYKFHLNSSIAIEGVLDENDLVSNSPVHLLTQSSAKAYVDAHSVLHEGVHGVVSHVVGVDETQILNNKTYNDPVLNGSVSGTGVSDDGTLSGASHDKLVTEWAVKEYVDTGGVINANQLQGYEPIDEDSFASNSNMHLPSQQSVKAYVDNSGVYAVIGSIVGTSQIQTLTNKTLTDPVINGNLTGTGILDQDDLASNSSLQLATQRSIKFYVDTHTGASIVHGLTGNVVGDTDIQTLSNKTLTDPVLNGTLSGTAFLDEDDMVSNSAIATSSQQAIKAYVDKYRAIGDIKFNYDLITISATQPWYNLSNADTTLSTTNYPDFVPYLRAIMLRYDPLGANTTDFSVTNWAIVTNVATLTFADLTPENTILLNLAEDQLVHGSYTDWRTITLPLAIGDIVAGEYAITDINLTNRTISFAYTADNNSGAVTSNVNFYPHRIVGSTTTARMFKTAGRGFVTAGANVDVEYIAGLRLRDSLKEHRHTLEAENDIGTVVPLVEPDASGATLTGKDANWAGIGANTYPSVQTALTGDDETRAKTYNAFAYIYVGTYTP